METIGGLHLNFSRLTSTPRAPLRRRPRLIYIGNFSRQLMAQFNLRQVNHGVYLQDSNSVQRPFETDVATCGWTFQELQCVRQQRMHLWNTFRHSLQY